MRELRDRYAWADEDYDLAWTVAVVQGRSSDYVLKLYGAGSEAPLGELAFIEAMKLRNDNFDEFGLLQLLEHEQYVVVIEPNGWRGGEPEVARHISQDGAHFFSVYWSPSAFQILQAKDGQVTARFDPNYIGLPAGANDMLPGWVSDDDFPLKQLKASCLAAMEQETGVAFERTWLDTKLPTCRIPNPDEMLKNIEDARET